MAAPKTLWLSFGDLKPGDRFHWAYGVASPATVRYSPIAYTKSRRKGWYTDGRNSFRAGGSTGAVILCAAPEPGEKVVS